MKPSTPFDVDESPSILDGGLGSELEKKGFYLKTSLWSAKLLDTNPQAILEVHLKYFNAGAEYATSNTYQASIEGFTTEGYSVSEAAALIWKGVEVANEARAQIYKQRRLRQKQQQQQNDGNNSAAVDVGSDNEDEDGDEDENKFNGGTEELSCTSAAAAAAGELHDLKVLRSCGPYAAFLHNGSEYTGNYGDVSNEQITNLHRLRLDILRKNLSEDSDRILFETIPTKRECFLILDLLREYPDLTHKVWISFSCGENEKLRCGAKFSDVVMDVINADQHSKFICGIGVNCSSPSATLQCFQSLQQSSRISSVTPHNTPVTLIAYPNSGVFSDNKCSGIPVKKLLNCGVRAIGGCCSIGPSMITRIRSEVQNWMKNDFNKIKQEMLK